MNIGLCGVNILAGGAPAPRLNDNSFGVRGKRSVLCADKRTEKCLKHSRARVVRHDPYTEPLPLWFVLENQTARRHFQWNVLKEPSTDLPNTIPSAIEVFVGIKYDPQACPLDQRGT